MEYQRVIMGIDPGTNVMGYAIIGINEKTPSAVAMGVIELSKFESHYKRLGRIFQRVTSLIDQYLPDELAIEAPFFGKNVQSMLKLGRAQGVAMAAALMRDIPIAEYEPRKIKLSITGNGAASKEQVKEMIKRTIPIPPDSLDLPLDATDAMAAALCHYYQSLHPTAHGIPKTWADFVKHNPGRVSIR